MGENQNYKLISRFVRPIHSVLKIFQPPGGSVDCNRWPHATGRDSPFPASDSPNEIAFSFKKTSKEIIVRVQKTIVRPLVCLTVLALTVSAFAADHRNFIIVGRQVMVKHPSKVITPTVWKNEPTLTTIAGNLSDFPFGVFFALYNYYVTGPNNTIGVPEYWQGVPFTPSANIKAMEVDASVVHAEGTNEVVLSLYNDANGLPGKAIHTWHVKNLAGFGSCCQLAIGKSKAGIALTKGKQYWVVAKTDSSNSDVFDGWDLNTTDMRAHPLASYCSGTTTQCGNNNNKWFPGSAILPGFAVQGK
jgi:hypothetical protein